MKRTGSWTLALKLIPTSSKDNYDVWERVWGSAIFLGYETETRNYFFTQEFLTRCSIQIKMILSTLQ